MKGKLIAVEGLDGTGKSTQIHLLKRWMELTGVKVFYTEWSSSVVLDRATRKGKKRHLLTPTTFCLLHATDFADRYERQILPLLKGGYIVLCDRYIYTAFARDAVRGVNKEWVRKLYSFAVKPEIVFYLNTPLKLAVNRSLETRTSLSYHDAGLDLKLASDEKESFKLYQEKILSEYDTMKREFGFTVKNGVRPIEDLQEDLREVVADKIDFSRFRWRNKP